MNKKAPTKVQYLTIDPEYAGQRIDNFLITRLKGVPKTRIYRILRKGEVRVNKKRVKPGDRLEAGDSVRIPPVTLDEKQEFTPNTRLIELLKSRIIFEDAHLLIINKPSGIPVHGGSKTPLGIIEILKTAYPKIPHLELVHRLDADTSGCLILAKKRSILKELHEMLREHKVRKIYWALTKGHWQPNEYKVDAPLRKNILQSGERVVKVDKNEGKTSLTYFKPLEVFSDSTLVEVKLETGRTHQIRVHTQYKKHPIAGDEKYGDKEFNKIMKERGLKRLFLHAYSLDFTLASGQKVHVEADLDEDLKKVLSSL